jgi:hypothetical protein
MSPLDTSLREPPSPPIGELVEEPPRISVCVEVGDPMPVRNPSGLTTYASATKVPSAGSVETTVPVTGAFGLSS